MSPNDALLTGGQGKRCVFLKDLVIETQLFTPSSISYFFRFWRLITLHLRAANKVSNGRLFLIPGLNGKQVTIYCSTNESTGIRHLRATGPTYLVCIPNGNGPSGNDRSRLNKCFISGNAPHKATYGIAITI